MEIIELALPPNLDHTPPNDSIADTKCSDISHKIAFDLEVIEHLLLFSLLIIDIQYCFFD